MNKIIHKDELLQNIADGLHENEQRRLSDLEVQFLEDTEVVLSVSVSMAIDYLVNDIYWDGSSDWSQADSAIVRVL